LLRLINWKGAPPCRLPFDPVPLQEGETGSLMASHHRL